MYGISTVSTHASKYARLTVCSGRLRICSFVNGVYTCSVIISFNGNKKRANTMYCGHRTALSLLLYTLSSGGEKGLFKLGKKDDSSSSRSECMSTRVACSIRASICPVLLLLSACSYIQIGIKLIILFAILIHLCH